VPEVGELRKIPLLIATGLILVCVALELGAAGFLRGAGDVSAAVDNVRNSDAFEDIDGDETTTPGDGTPAGETLQSVQQAATEDEPPGIGIPYLALVDGILAYSLLLMCTALVVPDHIQAKLQGVVSLILSFFLALGSIVLILLALAQLLIMVTLFFAPPFGTIAYLAVWGDFPKGDAAVVLGLLVVIKIGASICLPIAHQRFLQAKGLIVLILTSFLATIIVSFLHGLVPGPLVSITDALAGIIVGIIALIWAIVILIGSIIAVIQAVTTS
jgi:hypothetical protein